jgi:hypothetical protein
MITSVSFQELERPTEWLRSLAEDPRAWQRLLQDAGSFAAAAHRLAVARCRTAAVPARVPTERELAAAAIELAQRVGHVQPSNEVLFAECERDGLVVIEPLGRRSARAA